MSVLKVVVSGSRCITGDTAYTVFKEHMSDSLAKHRNNTLSRFTSYTAIIIVSGGADGVDQYAKRYAKENAFLYREFKPMYISKSDKRAPLRRNVDMAEVGDILVAMWNGKSPGTRHMVNTMEKTYKKPVYMKKYTH